MSECIRERDRLAAFLDEVGARGRPPLTAAVWLVDPRAFEVVYAINPHMRPGTPVDSERARGTVEALRRAYEGIGYPVGVLPAVPGLPDLVFLANQSLPFLRADGSAAALLSRMRHPERRPEVAHVAAALAERGFATIELPGDEEKGPFLEGHGDLLWHPGARLLIGGYGPRTDLRALELVARTTGVPVLPLELVDPRLYHLDTALAPLDARRALIVPEAFTEAGRELIATAFSELLEVPTEEAVGQLAANAHCPDGRHVLVEAAAERTRKLLAEAGFRVLPIDTEPFLASGGSVFCLKLCLPATRRRVGGSG